MESKELERLEKHLDGRFDNIGGLLSEIKTATEDNTKNIISLQEQQKNTASELAEWKYNEQSQHKEFYRRITEIEQVAVKESEHKSCSSKISTRIDAHHDFIVSQKTTNKLLIGAIPLVLTIYELIKRVAWLQRMIL